MIVRKVDLIYINDIRNNLMNESEQLQLTLDHFVFKCFAVLTAPKVRYSAICRAAALKVGGLKVPPSPPSARCSQRYSTNFVISVSFHRATFAFSSTDPLVACCTDMIVVSWVQMAVKARAEIKTLRWWWEAGSGSWSSIESMKRLITGNVYIKAPPRVGWWQLCFSESS